MTSILTPRPSAFAPATRQIALAERYLERALAIVDRLFADDSTGVAASNAYPLSEANRAIHHALVALSECRADPLWCEGHAP
ncbi:MAG TPA: hypothetical protein VED63_05850 [Acidimicrobiales bacterium]|nr:hypothetical protein [Acidimicrobiales bacterium]